jgi:hypothetical protein
MANRSNRRRQNPRMSRCEKHEKAIGSRRANSQSWPVCRKSIHNSEAGYTCAVEPTRGRTVCLQPRGSPYRPYVVPLDRAAISSEAATRLCGMAFNLSCAPLRVQALRTALQRSCTPWRLATREQTFERSRYWLLRFAFTRILASHCDPPRAIREQRIW